MARGVGGIGPANIMKHLKGIHFPADKKQLLDLVEQNRNRPGMSDTEDVKSILGKVEDKQYGSVAEIMKEIGKIE